MKFISLLALAFCLSTPVSAIASKRPLKISSTQVNYLPLSFATGTAVLGTVGDPSTVIINKVANMVTILNLGTAQLHSLEIHFAASDITSAVALISYPDTSLTFPTLSRYNAALANQSVTAQFSGKGGMQTLVVAGLTNGADVYVKLLW